MVVSNAYHRHLLSDNANVSRHQLNFTTRNFETTHNYTLFTTVTHVIRKRVLYMTKKTIHNYPQLFKTIQLPISSILHLNIGTALLLNITTCVSNSTTKATPLSLSFFHYQLWYLPPYTPTLVISINQLPPLLLIS